MAVVKIATLVGEVTVRETTSANPRPRFAVVELGGPMLAAALAGAGRRPDIAAADVALVASRALSSVDVVVISCTERSLMDPAMTAELDRIAGAVPRLAVVDEEGADAAAYAARLGWRGYVAGCDADEIIRAIEAVARGELAFPGSATSALVRTLARVAPLEPSTASALTPRQRQIVALLAEGATDAEIADLLQISRSTAHKHVMNARRRLRAKTRSQLVAASRDLASRSAAGMPAVRRVV